MRDFQVTLLPNAPLELYGVQATVCHRTLAREISTLSAQYTALSKREPRRALPFYVVSCNDSADAESFELFLGSTTPHAGLERFAPAAFPCASLTVRPKLGFLWGAAIGEAKRWFYTRWLPASEYLPLQLEYELHTEKTLGKSPSLELRFALQKREDSAKEAHRNGGTLR